MDKDEWILRYRPLLHPDGEFVTYDVVEDLKLIETQDEKKIWTEIWDFDSEQPFLVGGIVLDENGGILWYVCENSWSEDDLDIVEWEEH